MDCTDIQQSAITAVGLAKRRQIFQGYAVTNGFSEKVIDEKDTTENHATALQHRGSRTLWALP